jgi:Tfp pilus assembly protein PilN
MQRDINFFSVYRSPVEAENGVDIITMVGLSLIGVCIIGLIGIFAFNKINDVSIRSQQQKINSFLQSSEVKKAEGTWNSYTEKSKVLKSYENKANSEVSAFKTLPVLDSDLLGAVSGAMPSDVKVISISYTGNTIALTCTAGNKLSPANFVHTLKGTGKFDSVTYVGVTYISDAEYDFTVTCAMKGGDGK